MTDLTSVSAGAWVIGTDAVDGLDVSVLLSGAVAVAVAWLLTAPLSTSAWVVT